MTYENLALVLLNLKELAFNPGARQALPDALVAAVDLAETLKDALWQNCKSSNEDFNSILDTTMQNKHKVRINASDFDDLFA